MTFDHCLVMSFGHCFSMSFDHCLVMSFDHCFTMSFDHCFAMNLVITSLWALIIVLLSSPITSSLGEGLSKCTPMTVKKILKIIKNSPTKSCSLDPLPTWLLKKTDTLLPTITQIINKSLTSGTFPTSFKSALVLPLLKKTNLDTEVLRNYRPVSNLQYTSKVLEEVVAAQLTSYKRKHDLYEKKQFAYRCYHSTETALLKVLNDLLVAMYKSCGVFLVLLDVSAAFDTIDHDILIKRPHDNLGLSGTALAWINSYLRGRSQSVVINGTKSEPADLHYVVPQGSVLGPIPLNLKQKHCEPSKNVSLKSDNGWRKTNYNWTIKKHKF